MSTQLKVLNKTLPCATCKAECCGSFPLGTHDYRKIIDYLRTLPKEQVLRLARMTRKPWDCAFVDKEKYNCGVYAARPLVCRLYGRTPDLTCVYLPESTGEVSAPEAMLEIATDVMSQEYFAHSGAATLATLMQFIHSVQYSDAQVRAYKLDFDMRDPHGLTWDRILKDLGEEYAVEPIATTNQRLPAN